MFPQATLSELRRQASGIVRSMRASVTFERSTQVYDPATDSWSGTPISATADAAEIPGDPDRFAALGLTLRDSCTLVVDAPKLIAAAFVPQADDDFEWAGVKYTVRSVEPRQPDGTPINYLIIGSK